MYQQLFSQNILIFKKLKFEKLIKQINKIIKAKITKHVLIKRSFI